MTFTHLKRRVVILVLALQAAACQELSQVECEDGVCIPAMGKCAGSFFNTSGTCCEDTVCVVKNFWFAQCLSEQSAVVRVSEGWDGTLLESCDEMPIDAAGSPYDAMAPHASPIDDLDCEDDYCTPTFEQCGNEFNTSTLCCDPEAACVVKNWFYAQCLTESRAAQAVAVGGWDGRVLHCEEMPDDAPLAHIGPAPETEVLDQSSGLLSHAPSLSPSTNGDEVPSPPPATIKPVVLPLPSSNPLPEPQAPEEPIEEPVEAIEPVVTPTPLSVVDPPVADVPVAPGEPVTPGPVTAQPVTTVPATTEPVIAEPVTMAPVSPSVTEPVTTDPSPAEEEMTFQGDLTYYGGAGEAGHCTQTYVPEGFNTVALNAPQYALGASCGMCVHGCFDNLELGQGERCIDAIVDDECPECHHGDLDLGENGSGRWPVGWHIIECPGKPDGLLFTTQGSNPYYAKVKAQGGPSSVASMTCNGMPGTLQPDAFFVFMSSTGEFACGMDCLVTYSNGFDTLSGSLTAAQLGGQCN